MVTPVAGRPDAKRREPLWDRVDRNRFRLIAYLALFLAVASASIGSCLWVAAVVLWLLGPSFDRSGNVQTCAQWMLERGFLHPWVLGMLAAALYEVWALGRTEKWLLRRLRATLVPKGERLETKMALKDMAIASGMPVAPALYSLPSDNVNAFVFKAPGRRAVVGVTQGVFRRLTVDEQRALFANLSARLASGDTMVSSAVTSLLAPLQMYRAHRLRAIDAEDALMRDLAEEQRLNPESVVDSPGLSYAMALLPFLGPAIFAGEVLAAIQRRSQLTAAEKADAEGMLLLKDPPSMLSALEKSVRLNNTVVEAGDSLGDLFYCWTGQSTDDDDDPEWRRVARLREVLGVEGWVTSA